MKLVFTVHTEPQSFDAEDAMENALMDAGLQADLEGAIESEIEAIMGWRDLRVCVERVVP